MIASIVIVLPVLARKMDVPSISQEKEIPEKEDANVVTMVDVLEEENELEEDAYAVLGGADDKACTYSKVF